MYTKDSYANLPRGNLAFSETQATSRAAVKSIIPPQLGASGGGYGGTSGRKNAFTHVAINTVMATNDAIFIIELLIISINQSILYIYSVAHVCKSSRRTTQVTLSLVISDSYLFEFCSHNASLPRYAHCSSSSSSCRVEYNSISQFSVSNPLHS